MLADRGPLAPPSLRVVAAEPPPGEVSRETSPLEPVADDVLPMPDGSFTSVALHFRTADLRRDGVLAGCGRCPGGSCRARVVGDGGLSCCHLLLRGRVSRDAILSDPFHLEP